MSDSIFNKARRTGSSKKKASNNAAVIAAVESTIRGDLTEVDKRVIGVLSGFRSVAKDGLPPSTIAQRCSKFTQEDIDESVKTLEAVKVLQLHTEARFFRVCLSTNYARLVK